jgi:hypothetical protein
MAITFTCPGCPTACKLKVPIPLALPVPFPPTLSIPNFPPSIPDFDLPELPDLPEFPFNLADLCPSSGRKD